MDRRLGEHYIELVIHGVPNRTTNQLLVLQEKRGWNQSCSSIVLYALGLEINHDQCSPPSKHLSLKQSIMHGPNYERFYFL